MAQCLEPSNKNLIDDGSYRGGAKTRGRDNHVSCCCLDPFAGFVSVINQPILFYWEGGVLCIGLPTAQLPLNNLGCFIE